AARAEPRRAGGAEPGPGPQARQPADRAGLRAAGRRLGGGGRRHRLRRPASAAPGTSAGAPSPGPPADSLGAGRRQSRLSGRHGGAPAAAGPRTEAGRADRADRRAAVHLAGVEGTQAMDLIRLDRLAVPGRLQPLRLALAPGEMLGVIGPNGAGKSTLLNALAGVQPYSGTLDYLGFDAPRLGH